MTIDGNADLGAAEKEVGEAIKQRTKLTQRARACIDGQFPCDDRSFGELMNEIEVAESRVRKALEDRYMLNRYQSSVE